MCRAPGIGQAGALAPGGLSQDLVPIAIIATYLYPSLRYRIPRAFATRAPCYPGTTSCSNTKVLAFAYTVIVQHHVFVSWALQPGQGNNNLLFVWDNTLVCAPQADQVAPLFQLDEDWGLANFGST